LIVNYSKWIDRAEILWEKGTNRTLFARGEIDKYSWVDLGSSYLPGEITAAFLWAQFEDADAIRQRRLEIWHAYHRGLQPLESAGLLRRPIVPVECAHNAHMYYILLPRVDVRVDVQAKLNQLGVMTATHYVPLHLSLGGRRFGRPGGSLDVTESVGERLV